MMHDKTFIIVLIQYNITGGPNSSQFLVVNKLTKLLKKLKSFGDSVFHVNNHPPIKF